MSEPPPAERFPTEEPGDIPVPPDAGPTGTPPRLLVLPPTDGLSPIVWPGAADQPAWAIPVTVPPGTRGYAIFLPLVAADDPAATAPGTSMVAASTTPPAAAAPVSARPPATPPVSPVPAAHAPAPRSAEAADEPSPERAPREETVAPASSGPALSSTTQGPESSPPTEPDAEAASPPAQRIPETAAASQRAPEATPPAPDTAVRARTSDGTPVASAQATPARPDSGGAVAAVSGPAPATSMGTPVPSVPGYRMTGSPYEFRSRPLQPSFLDRAWPGPAPARDRATPLAVLAGALGVAAFVPLGRAGVGWFLGWLVLTAGVLVAVRRHTADLPRAQRWVRAGWAGAALALLAVLAFRNAWWLVTFCVLAALCCAALAIVGGRRMRSILFSLGAAPLAALRGLPWVRAHIRAPGGDGTTRRVVGSVTATVAVLVVFGALLSSADAAFSQALGVLIPEVSGGGVVRWLFLAAVGGLIAVAALYTLAAPPDLSLVDLPTARRLSLVEWAPPIAALTALFGGFVLVQFTVLFGGQRHVLSTTGLSYSEYARSGFWQLVAVTVLTLAILGGVTRWARRDTPRDRVLLRILLGLLSALSVVIVVSALSRMWTYQKVYSFTGERVFVMAFELLLGAVFLMVLVAGVRWRGDWIPRLTTALAVVMLLGLAALNPEDYVARRNIDRYQETGRIDAWYLRALSADATPALAALPDPVRRCTLSWIADDLAEPDPWYAWNRGRDRARAVLDRLGPEAIGNQRDCRRADQFDLPKTRR
ncbi:DUF4153 domain-containing protein [Micromonospora sp. NPDC002389]|uniref:DUF4153 domain-containing protein n=1 Tax=Micromonospora sp. NPDC002389 TaxID=3154272 RepID=UPI00332536EB